VKNIFFFLKSQKCKINVNNYDEMKTRIFLVDYHYQVYFSLHDHTDKINSCSTKLITFVFLCFAHEIGLQPVVETSRAGIYFICMTMQWKINLIINEEKPGFQFHHDISASSVNFFKHVNNYDTYKNSPLCPHHFVFVMPCS